MALRLLQTDRKVTSTILPETPDTIRAAIDDANIQRAHMRLMGIPNPLVPYPDDAEPWGRAVAINALVEFMGEHGAATVGKWVKTQAALMGVEIK
jgi:hypothetical protein